MSILTCLTKTQREIPSASLEREEQDDGDDEADDGDTQAHFGGNVQRLVRALEGREGWSLIYPCRDPP